MPPRAERRRIERKQKRATEDKTTPEAYRELSKREKEDAEEELKAGAHVFPTDVPTRWAALLDKWIRYESQRESAKADYDLRAELPQGTATQAIESYATAKRALIGIEREMVALLQDAEPSDRISLLHDRFLFHAVGFSRQVFVSDTLRPRLEDALAKTLGFLHDDSLEAKEATGPQPNHAPT